ncbi:hypothetical protein D3C81_974890 [compost metagenome]
MVTLGSVYGPEVSYTVIGGFSSPPNRVGVRVCAISRIGTCRSAREPGTKILCEPGIGLVTDSESCCACCCRLGCAFIGIRPVDPHTCGAGVCEGFA